MAPRRLDPNLRTALAGQATAVADWLAPLTDDELLLPSVLSGWRIAELAVHLAHVHTALADALAVPRPKATTRPLTIARYTGQYAAGADEIADRERAAAHGLDSAGIRRLYAAETQRLAEGLAALDGTDPVVNARRGPIRVGDMVRTRITELVVHADDAARSLPGRPGPVSTPAALRIAVRMFTEIVSERYPGRSIEVRIPPYAAVQCGPEDGPTHTRGTPPTVVECQPAAWVAVAAGRRSFAAAVADVSITASGARADLAVFLPLIS